MRPRRRHRTRPAAATEPGPAATAMAGAAAVLSRMRGDQRLRQSLVAALLLGPTLDPRPGFLGAGFAALLGYAHQRVGIVVVKMDQPQ